MKFYFNGITSFDFIFLIFIKFPLSAPGFAAVTKGYLSATCGQWLPYWTQIQNSAIIRTALQSCYSERNPRFSSSSLPKNGSNLVKIVKTRHEAVCFHIKVSDMMLFPGDLVKMQTLAEKVWNRAHDSAVLTSSRMTSMLLVHGSHFDYQKI